MYSFREVYGGWLYLAIGLVGVVLGTCIAQLASRWRKPVLAEAFVAVLMFMVVGGALAARGSSLGGVLPTGHTFAQLWHASTFGWKELLTTAPPVGDSSNLLAIPYLVGLVGGITGTSIACRTRFSALPLIGPAIVLAVGILFGSRVPASLLLQGTILGGLAIAWVAIRFHRNREVVSGSSFGRRRVVTAGGLLVAVVLLAGLLGPVLPGAHSHTRVVLSRYVVPPFDIANQPSPLAGFRRYTPTAELNDAILFAVRGYHPSKMRIATMDEYNGLVWGFGASGSTASAAASADSFQRFGTTIPAGTPGPSHVTTVTMGKLGGLWIPADGEATSIEFSGQDSAQLTEDVRYDTATGTAAETAGLTPGDTYTLDAVVPPSPTAKQELEASAGSSQPAITNVPTAVRTFAEKWAGSATSPWEKVVHIASQLKLNGRFSDGSSAAAGGATLSLPGHGAGRLTMFFNGWGPVGTQIVGDDEQYAAAMALMANAVGVPARVVLGADVPSSGIVRGKDVHAWIEVQLDGIGWVSMYQTSFMNPNNPPNKTPPTPQPQPQVAHPIQPPAISAVRSPLNSQLPGTNGASTSPDKNPGGPLLPAWLWTIVRWLLAFLILASLVIGTILGLKRRRRRRRYGAARPSTRIVGAWAELVDLERDLGRDVPDGATRREQVPYFASPDAGPLATRADAAVFGAGDPTPEEIDAYWASIDRFRSEATTGLSRLNRWKVALSLRSLGLVLPRRTPAA